MFRRLDQPFEDFHVFRCKMCHQILFSSQEVIAYIKSYSDNLDSLGHVQNYPINQDQVSFFMFDQDIQLSSIQKGQNQQSQSVLFQKHPFLMMYMSKLSCSQCQAQLGYYIYTVNENTLFMLKRSIINIKALQVFQNQVDRMVQIVAKLDQNLAQQNHLLQIQEQKLTKNQQRQQKILAEYRKSIHFNKQKQKNKLMTTNRTTLNNNPFIPTNNNNTNTRPLSFISKFETRPLASTNIDTDYLTSYPLFAKQKEKQRQQQNLNEQQKFQKKQQIFYQTSLKQANHSIEVEAYKKENINSFPIKEKEIELIEDSIINQEKLLQRWIAHQENLRQPIKQILNSFKSFYQIIKRKYLKSQDQKKQFVKINHLIQNEVTSKLRNN